MSDETSIQFPNFQSDRYRILSEVGKGGAGVVYKAQDKTLNKIVAIKKLYITATDQEAMRFHREAKMAGSLSHPNVLSAFDFGLTEKNEPYMVLTFLEGESLSDLLDRTGPMPAKEAMELFVQIAEGLAYAHRKNVIHRDIKPSNVMLVNEEGALRAKIVDFGLAKSTSEKQSLTESGIGLGTPVYMSPEQITGDQVDARCDIYSFGCLMYETLSGSPPFEATNLLDMLDMHKNQIVPPLSERGTGDGVPEEFEALIMKCLEKKPKNRFPNADELLAALKKLEASEESASDSGSGADLPAIPEGSSARNKFLIPVVVLTLLLGSIVCVTIFSATPEKKKPKVNTSEQLPSFARSAGGETEPKISASFNDGFYSADPDATDEDLKNFAKNAPSDLRILSLTDSQITPDGLKYLAKVQVHEMLWSKHPLTKEALKNLVNIQGLRSLTLEKNTDVDLESLPELGKLKLNRLALTDTELNKPALTAIGAMLQLTWLDLSGTNGLSADGLKQLSNLKNLEYLDVKFTDIDNEGIAAIAVLPIEQLILNVNRINKNTAKSLLSMKSLKTILVPEKIGEFNDTAKDLRKKGLAVESLKKSNLKTRMAF